MWICAAICSRKLCLISLPIQLTRKLKTKEARRQFEADAISSQSNVLPLDAARNEGRFYGKLIRGERQLSGVSVWDSSSWDYFFAGRPSL